MEGEGDLAEPILMAAATAGKALTKGEKAGLLKRVLGPPADALGDALARWVEFRTMNVGRILENADRKLGSRADEPGAVPPRIGSRILEEGSYCDDAVMVEYLGGVLASARSEVGRDDRGARWVSLVTALSAYEIRLHYILYGAAQQALLRLGRRVPWGNEGAYGEIRFFFGWAELAAAMEFHQSENGLSITNEALFALHREGLIADLGVKPSAVHEKELGRKAPSQSGVVHFAPNTVGVQLFMWAHGVGNGPITSFDDPDFDLPKVELAVPPAHALEELNPLDLAPTPGS